MVSNKRLLSLFLVLAFAVLLSAPAMAEYDKNNPQNLTEEHLFAQSALLVDEDSGEVLFSKNSKVRMYPASTTKIMTLMLALESDIALDSQVTIPAEAADIPEGSSVVPVKPGDEMSFTDLLYGFMLSSGNDGANAVAVLVDGSIEAFVERMNRRAAELGCDGTHYVNAHGYHDSEHYTTARDLAIIAREAMRNEDFRKIVAAPKWTMSIVRGDSTVETEVISRNSLLQSGEKYYYPECTGIKTGHHRKAGWCFVGSAERDGMRVICVVLNCEQEMSKWYDAARLFEYGFTRYERVTASALMDLAQKRQYSQIQVENADPSDSMGGSLELNLSIPEGGDAEIPVIAGSEASLNAAADRLVSVEWSRDFVAPIEEDEVVGVLTCDVNGTAAKGTLTADRSVSAKPEPTPVPTAAPTASAPAIETQTSAPSNGGEKTGGSVVGIILALAALLLIAVVALALCARQAKLRRERERRRRRRQAQNAANRRPIGTARNSQARGGRSGVARSSQSPRRRDGKR